MDKWDFYGYCRKMQDYILRKHPWGENSNPYREAEEMVAPVRWYFGTGRAAWEWCVRLTAKPAYIVARELMKGGSYDEALARVHQLIGWN